MAKLPGRRIQPSGTFPGAQWAKWTRLYQHRRSGSMRLYFPDIERPKAAAKFLARLSPEVTLASAHEALACASGYRDWHELSASFHAPGPDPTAFSTQVATELVLALALSLNLECGDVQYALSKARLLGAAPWGIDEQLAVHMAAIRQQDLGAPARGKPGTIVKVKTIGGPRVGYLLWTDSIVNVLYDSGEGCCATFEAVTPRTPIADFLPARLWLPYGIWTLEDGSEVVFARDYLPLWRISAEGVERLDPWLWINGIKSHRWFAANTEGDWWRPGGRVPALAYLEQHRIFELPRLANAMRYMFAPGVRTMRGAVRRMHGQSYSDATAPTFAMLRPNMVETERVRRTGT
ncbi:hypothetical protein GRI89_04975 [Altererythrobacter salegens]|uniref:Uncharacterized protein n=1 Tax=Croceibacterium salegens TaxID=1737568 RepID=A0A6I4SX08_9SPHN|nr:hypothetical protein [Croceibacterium salegens]MXO58892.1 hypothetical protein [Croceibacterium salegens]